MGIEELNQHDIIQINPDSTVRDEFKGRLAIVDEPRSWGCVAYVEGFDGRAFVRLTSDQYVKVGALEWLPQEA